jgi:hypothetical protein
MIAPYRVTQVQGAWIGGSTNHCTANRTSGRAQGRVTCRGTDRGTAGGTKQCAAGSTIARIRTATGDQQGRRKTNHHCRAHIWLPSNFVNMETRRGEGRFRPRPPFPQMAGKCWVFFGIAGPKGRIAIGQDWGETAALVAVPVFRTPRSPTAPEAKERHTRKGWRG